MWGNCRRNGSWASPARATCRVFAKKLRIQYAPTLQSAYTIKEVRKPRGAGLIIKVAHQYLITRSIRWSDVSLMASRVPGRVRDPHTRVQEFLSIVSVRGSALHGE